MKNFLLAIFLCSGLITSLSAQSEGCGTSRYTTNVFTTTKKTTVKFGEATTQLGITLDLKMDVYEPEGDMAVQRPLIIWAHGGSFIAGTRNDLKATCIDYAQKGYVTATIDYRLWPLALGYPDSVKVIDQVMKAMHDMKASIRYFRQDAATTNTFHIDPKNILLGGYSAGALMALHTADMDEEDEALVPSYVKKSLIDNGGWEGNSGDAENLKYSSRNIRGVINFSGSLHKRSWLDANDVPMVSMHGTADATVPYYFGLTNGLATSYGSKSLSDRADSLGIPNYMHSVTGGGHTDIYTDAKYATERENFAKSALPFLKNLICQKVAIDETNVLQQQLLAYPNPTSEAMTIELGDVTGTHLVTITNAFGQTMQQFETNATQFSIYKKDLGKGFFVVNVRNEKGDMGARKVIFE